jgi:hypothetical protein
MSSGGTWNSRPRCLVCRCPIRDQLGASRSWALLGLEGVYPDLLGAGDGGDGFGGVGVVLAPGEQVLDVADDLLVEALVYAAQVGQLLGGQQQRRPADRAR